MCGCVNELYLSKVLELDQQTASAVMAATAATLSLRATLTVNVMSTKSACFCNWKAEVVILRVWKYYRKDSFRERHFCWITRFVAKNTSLVQWEACGNLASCDLFQEDDGERERDFGVYLEELPAGMHFQCLGWQFNLDFSMNKTCVFW